MINKKKIVLIAVGSVLLIILMVNWIQELNRLSRLNVLERDISSAGIDTQYLKLIRSDCLPFCTNQVTHFYKNRSALSIFSYRQNYKVFMCKLDGVGKIHHDSLFFRLSNSLTNINKDIYSLIYMGEFDLAVNIEDSSRKRNIYFQVLNQKVKSLTMNDSMKIYSLQSNFAIRNGESGESLIYTVDGSTLMTSGKIWKQVSFASKGGFAYFLMAWNIDSNLPLPNNLLSGLMK